VRKVNKREDKKGAWGLGRSQKARQKPGKRRSRSVKSATTTGLRAFLDLTGQGRAGREREGKSRPFCSPPLQGRFRLDGISVLGDMTGAKGSCDLSLPFQSR
jgi:hypothetical protein